MPKTFALIAVGAAALATVLTSPAAQATTATVDAGTATATTADASLALAPTVKTIRKGATVTLTITVNTGGHPVNTVQAYLNFPDAQLDCSAFTLASTFPSLAAKSCNGSTAAIAGSIPPGSTAFTGTAVFAKATFTATHTGKAVVSFDRTRTLVPDASSGADVLGSWNSATITVKR